PNPFTNETFITAESLVAGDFQFEVFDLLGKRIYLKKIRLEIGHNEFAFDASELSNGAHFYTLSNNDGKAVRQMIVAR
nr:T9SS type A sorting domain-containing protein [Saprospiraceae bacterium]